MRLSVVIAIVVLVTFVIQTSHLASTVHQNLQRRINVCSSQIQETLSILCSTDNYSRRNPNVKRNGYWWWRWLDRPRAIRINREESKMTGDNEPTDDFKLAVKKSRRTGIADECCDRSCSITHLAQYCPRRLNDRMLLANYQMLLLLEMLPTTEASTQTTSLTLIPGKIITDRHDNSFSLEYVRN